MDDGSKSTEHAAKIPKKRRGSKSKGKGKEKGEKKSSDDKKKGRGTSAKSKSKSAAKVVKKEQSGKKVGGKK